MSNIASQGIFAWNSMLAFSASWRQRPTTASADGATRRVAADAERWAAEAYILGCSK
jgi:hypothetical protein